MSDSPAHGSDVQVTPEWWMASDGRYYPPELHPDYTPPAPAPEPAAPAPPAAAPVAEEPPANATIVSSLPPGGGQPLTGPGGPVAPAGPPSGVPGGPPPGGPPSGPPPGGPPPGPFEPPSGPQVAPLSSGPVADDQVVQGPGGITYTAPAEPSRVTVGASGAYGSPAGPPGAPVAAPGAPVGAPPGTPPQQQPWAQASTKVSSSAAALVALVAGIAAVAGSLLQWGKGSVVSAAGAQKATIGVGGFDSNGIFTIVAGGALILCGVLFFTGVPKQLYWAILAFVAGGVIVGAVVFSLIDINDLSERYRGVWQATAAAANGDVITTQPDLGLWIAGAGGVLGVLAAPFVNRD